MASILVNSPVPVTLLGGGETTPDELAEALTQAPYLVAADGGAAMALAAGRMPEAVIGDMDSLPADLRAQIPANRLFRIEEQDSTDFDKTLRSVVAPWILAVGFLGLRVDHQLANFTTLVRRHRTPCLALGTHDVIFAAPPERWISLDLTAGTRVSLFPMSGVTGRSDGLKWPIEGLNFAPDGCVGTSNKAVGPVRLWFDGPGMLVILPRQALAQAIRARCGTGAVPAI